MTGTPTKHVPRYRLRETNYSEKLEPCSISLTRSQINHAEVQAAKLSMSNPGEGWNRSKYIQWLIDQDILRTQGRQ